MLPDILPNSSEHIFSFSKWHRKNPSKELSTYSVHTWAFWCLSPIQLRQVKMHTKNPRQTPPSWVPFIVYIELNWDWRSCVFNCVIKTSTLFMMVFSFLFVVLTLPRISLLVNAFLKIVEKSKIFKMDSQKKKPRSFLSFSFLLC